MTDGNFYVNNVVLAGGTVTKIIEEGVGEKGDPFYVVSYQLGKFHYHVIVFDKFKKMIKHPFPATIYGSLTVKNGRIMVKVNSLIDNSCIKQPAEVESVPV